MGRVAIEQKKNQLKAYHIYLRNLEGWNNKQPNFPINDEYHSLKNRTKTCCNDVAKLVDAETIQNNCALLAS